MDWLQAIILGIIQGLTEFLPVSSSGHLELAKVVFNSDYSSKESLLMTVVLHFATAISTIVIFRKEVVSIIAGLFSKNDNTQRVFSFKIIISMLPAAVVGVFWNDLIESLFNEQVLLVGIMLIVTALVLYLADKSKPTAIDVSYRNSFVIGVAQAIAILPGISRSGATIATSVLLGVDKESAARFSFLMVVPLIFGKIAKDLFSDDLVVSSIDAIGLSFGFIAAFITGLFACKLMISLVKKSKLVYFSIYCSIVGIAAIVYSLS
ncbi:MAG: UDP-diphosphatase [Crocinitomicaceae bacterium]|nr:UDP-diphosphatase [Crocinitomicaceae bacterium]